MLKFIKGHMASMDNVEIFPLVSLAIFLTAFIGFTLYAIRARKENMNEMSQLPLEDQETQQ